MRLFTGLDLTPQTVSKLGELLATLRPAAQVHWSPLENLHITTTFIGAWPDERLEELHSNLHPLCARGPIRIKLQGLGWFPNARSPRVLWAGVDGGSALLDLAQDTGDALSRLGLAGDEHPYSPHLTLARIRQAVPLQQLRSEVAVLSSVGIGEFLAEGFHLYNSEAGPNASVYRKRHSYMFQPAGAVNLSS